MRYSILTRELVASRLGLGDFHAAWLTKLDEAVPSERLSEPDVHSLSALLTRLGVGHENAAEVLQTMPSSEHDPESYWLLERNHSIITSCLAARDTIAEPLPPLPASLKLFPAHLILVTIDDIRRRHQELGIPDDVSWETLSFLGQTMAAYLKIHGEVGIDLSRWDWMRFFGWLFQVGRLTVIPYRLCN